jgi:hypothetical protein
MKIFWMLRQQETDKISLLVFFGHLFRMNNERDSKRYGRQDFMEEDGRDSYKPGKRV